MTTETIITGTGNPPPDGDRAGAGVLVKHGALALQFDAGRATSMRLAAAGVGCGDLDALFITHHHSDHMVGLPDIVMSRWIVQHPRADEPLRIVAPRGEAVQIAEHMLDVWRDELTNRADHMERTTRPSMTLLPFDAGPTAVEVWRSSDVAVTAIEVHHEPLVPAVAYRVDTPDGSIVISGDTEVCAEVESISHGADVLVHEAMRAGVLRRAAAANPDAAGRGGTGIIAYHADAVEVGALAKRAGVRTLILTHLIPAPSTEKHRAGFVSDVRAGGFEGQVVVSDDLYLYTLGV
jgi:ribonuclease Z